MKFAEPSELNRNPGGMGHPQIGCTSKVGVKADAETHLERLCRIQASPSVSLGQANICRGNCSFGMFQWHSIGIHSASW